MPDHRQVLAANVLADLSEARRSLGETHHWDLTDSEQRRHLANRLRGAISLLGDSAEALQMLRTKEGDRV